MDNYGVGQRSRTLHQASVCRIQIETHIFISNNCPIYIKMYSDDNIIISTKFALKNTNKKITFVIKNYRLRKVSTGFQLY